MTQRLPGAREKKMDSVALDDIRNLLGPGELRKDLLIEYLHRIQDAFGGLSAAYMAALATEMRLAEAHVYEVASFYAHFDLVGDGEPARGACIRVCDSLSCVMAGGDDLLVRLRQAHGEGVRPAPCLGRCHEAPVAMVGHYPVCRADATRVSNALAGGVQEESLPSAYVDYADYTQRGGYALYRACLSGDRAVDEVIAEVERAGLRGLGGAGFPAARKWRILRDQPAPRLLVVNIDEGEPGTFKDRHYLERDPHRMLEGAFLGAWVIQAECIYIYLRDEYHGLHRMLRRELETLRQQDEMKLPAIELRRGAGSYVCGEESALIESLEGKRGMPRLRPPYIAQQGLFGRPTLEHNMETLYWLRDIVEKGAEWFAQGGRRGRRGMRSFSLSGRVKRPGMYRAPAGISLRELVDEYGGGMSEGHELYGYFPGGASGGMLPASLADLPLDFDTLAEYGCFIGSAAIIVFSQQDSARQLALNAMRFFADESCGQCTPCRVGTQKAVQLMQAKQWNQPLLRELAQTMMDASICGLGQAAPNPMLCAMRYFPGEFE